MPNEKQQTIEFVISEIIRISKIDPKERLRNASLGEAIALLPNPFGIGQISCGIEAFRRLENASTMAVAQSDFAGRMDSKLVFDAMKGIVTSRFLKEQREINQRECDKAFSTAIKIAKKSLADTVFWIPVHLGRVQNPSMFEIGPIKFEPMEDFLRGIDGELQNYIDKDDNRAEVRRNLRRTTESYYREFGWSARVEIIGCSPSIAKKSARRRVQHAIDCLHLLLGARHSDHMRMGGPNFFVDRRGQISRDGNGEVSISSSVDWKTNQLPDDWWEMVRADGFDQMVVLFGLAIEHGTDVANPAPLSQRILDALMWFGEAVRDEFQAARIVKYVTSIERLLVTEEKDEELVEKLSRRGASVLCTLEGYDFDESFQRLKKVYNLRSELVHGSRSPVDPRMAEGEREAEILARHVLFGFIGFTGDQGLRETDLPKKQLSENFRKLEKLVKGESG